MMNDGNLLIDSMNVMMSKKSSSSLSPPSPLTDDCDGIINNTINTNCGYCNEDLLIFALNSMRQTGSTTTISKSFQQQQQKSFNNVNIVDLDNDNDIKNKINNTDDNDNIIKSSSYYLCTVTCCESENCCFINDVQPTATTITTGKNLLQNDNNNVVVLDGRKQKKHSTSSSNQSTSAIIMDDDCCCELCQSSSITSNNNNINKQNQSKNLRILWADTFDEQSKQQLSEELSLPCNGNSSNNNHLINKNEIKPIKTSKEINYKKLKLKSLANNNYMMDANNQNGQLSPEMSSSSPFGNNSSNTEYTEICNTPDIHHGHDHNHYRYHHQNNKPSSLSIIQPLFKPNQLNNNNHPIQLTQLDYRLYFINDAEKHGFFRKAVPTLPLAIAVLFCMLNLLLPGSGKLSF